MDSKTFWAYWDDIYRYLDAYDIAIILELFDILCILLPLFSSILVGVHISRGVRFILVLTRCLIRILYILWNILESFNTKQYKYVYIFCFEIWGAVSLCCKTRVIKTRFSWTPLSSNYSPLPILFINLRSCSLLCKAKITRLNDQ